MFGGVWRVVIWDIYMGYLYLNGLVVCFLGGDNGVVWGGLNCERGLLWVLRKFLMG